MSEHCSGCFTLGHAKNLIVKKKKRKNVTNVLHQMQFINHKLDHCSDLCFHFSSDDLMLKHKLLLQMLAVKPPPNLRLLSSPVLQKIILYVI